MTGPPSRVLHLIATNFFGGPEKQILEHLERLDDTRFSGAVASFIEGGRPNETLERARAEGLESHGLPMHGPFDFRAQGRLTRLIESWRPDLLCTHGYKATVMGRRAAQRFGIPVVAFSRGYTAENRKVAFYEWLERRELPRVAGVIAVSEGQRRRLGELGVRPTKSWVVHNAVELPEALAPLSEEERNATLRSLGIERGARLVVTAGRLSPEKGQRHLVEAIALLADRHRDTVFVLCGDGPSRAELERLARRKGIDDRCRFPGFRDDLRQIFRAMDLLVLPSLSEGLPNVILEAFAVARPVLATSVGGVPEAVEDGSNGVLVPAGDPDRLARAIDACLADPERMERLALAGRETARTRFGFEIQTRGLEAIYAEVLAGPGR